MRDMTEFSARNLERCEAPSGFNHPINSWDLSDWFLATMGELGEAANVAKKLNRIRDGIRGNKESEAALRDKLRKEIGDTFCYLDLLAQACGFNVFDAAQEVFDAKSKEIGWTPSNTWRQRLADEMTRLDRNFLTLNELLALAKKHNMRPEEIEMQRRSWARQDKD